MAEKNNIKLTIKVRDEMGEKIKVKSVSSMNEGMDDPEFEAGNIRWYLRKFKEFLLAYGFTEHTVENIYFLEDGEKIIDEEGNTYDVHQL